MKVLTTNPHQFLSGDILDANDVARALRYTQDAFLDVSSLRVQEVPFRLPFMSGQSLTQASSIEERSARFRAPFDCTIERAILSANLIASATVNVTIETVAGATPDGVPVPWLTTGPEIASTPATTDTEDIAPERVSLVGGTTYVVRILPTGTMTVDRFDLTLHLRFDRWQLTTTTTLPSPAVTIPRSGDARNATTLNASLVSLASAALALASNNAPPTPIVVSASNFTTTNQVQHIPRALNTRAQGRVVRIDMFAHWDGAGTADVVTGELLDQTGAVLETITCAGGGGTQTSNTLACNRSLLSGSFGVTTTVAQDYQFRMRSSGATNVRKAYAILWVAR